MGYTPTTNSAMTLSNGPVKPVLKKMTWSQCWKAIYFRARDAGANDAVASAEADLTCGDPLDGTW